MTRCISGMLEIDDTRGVIYFHSDGHIDINDNNGEVHFNANDGGTTLRICRLPKPIPLTEFLDITHMHGCNWSKNDPITRSKWIVKENGKLARYPEINVHPSWSNCEFNTFKEAEEYAIKWLGAYAPVVGSIQPNEKFHYCGGKDYILIEEQA